MFFASRFLTAGYSKSGWIFPAAFLLIAVGVSLSAKKFRRESQLNYRLRQTMTMLEKSVSEMRRLQGQPLTLCTVTKRVKIGDE